MESVSRKPSSICGADEDANVSIYIIPRTEKDNNDDNIVI